MNKLQQNQEECYDACRADALGDLAARTFVACVTGESLGKPGDVHSDPSRKNLKQMAHGICSWEDMRADRIAREFGRPPQAMSVTDQTKAALWEIKNFYPKTWAALQGSDALTIMTVLVRDFERPRNPDTEITARMKHFASLPTFGASPSPLPAPPTQTMPSSVPADASKAILFILNNFFGGSISSFSGFTALLYAWLIYKGIQIPNLPVAHDWLPWILLGLLLLFGMGGPAQVVKETSPEEKSQPQELNMDPVLALKLFSALLPVLEKIITNLPAEVSLVKQEIETIKKDIAGLKTPAAPAATDEITAIIDKLTKLGV